ncbi:MAG: hypothetical protein H0X62_14175, partial [Bacteroidetes bacterium]|nr:hypothetical protein [Bacteroidota bacterium]
LIISLAILVRPIGVLLPFVYLLFVLIRKDYKSSLIFIFASYLLVFGWMYRNYEIFGRGFISTVGNWNLLLYRAAETHAEANNISITQAREILLAELLKETEKLADQNDYKENARFGLVISNQLSWKVISENKGIFIKNTLKNALFVAIKPARGYIDLMLFDNKKQALDGNISISTKILVGVQIIWLALAWILFLLGIWNLWNSRNYQVLIPILLAITYLMLASAGPEGDSRFRLPIIPFVLIVGAYGINKFLPETSNPKQKNLLSLRCDGSEHNKD